MSNRPFRSGATPEAATRPPAFPGLDDKRLLQTERAAADLRHGLPVVITDRGRGLLTMAGEFATEANLAAFENLAGGRARIVLTGQRAGVLKIHHKGRDALRIRRPDWMTAAAIASLADPTADLAHPLMGPFRDEPDAQRAIDVAAVRLLKHAHLLPTAIAADLDGSMLSRLSESLPLSVVPISAIERQDAMAAATLTEAARAPVPLTESADATIVAFRPASGGHEHLAILIGDPPRDRPVLTRLHSECFTGDLLASLKCDCGSQLRGAVDAINDAGGGVLLYLAQEGRGIGLISKLKAYALQDQGFDTVEANLRLGFDIDERIFEPAAQMLKKLGFSGVRLLTNNPDKISGLEACGIEVTERVEHRFPSNPHNAHYLKTKRDKTGHLL